MCATRDGNRAWLITRIWEGHADSAMYYVDGRDLCAVAFNAAGAAVAAGSAAAAIDAKQWLLASGLDLGCRAPSLCYRVLS